MARSIFQYSCGCGLIFGTLEAAVEHCDKTCHTLTVSGQVKPDEQSIQAKKLARIAKSSARQWEQREQRGQRRQYGQHEKRVVEHVEPVERDYGFGALRERLRRKGA